MPPSLYLREQAEQCRRFAEDPADPGLRDSLLQLADDYTAKAEARESAQTILQAADHNEDAD